MDYGALHRKKCHKSEAMGTELRGCWIQINVYNDTTLFLECLVGAREQVDSMVFSRLSFDAKVILQNLTFRLTC